MEYQPFIVFVFGPPGSGKSTQADRIAEEFGAVHLNTGALLKGILEKPDADEDPFLQEQRRIHEAGQLNDSAWVRDLIIREVERLAQEGKSVVFSGSPRTTSEAEGEISVFKKLFHNRLIVFFLSIPQEVSLKRNSRRRICASCGAMADGGESASCLLCGGKLVRRSDDLPEIIERRLRVFEERTIPILAFFKLQAIPVHEIDGTPSPEVVFQSLKAELEERLG